MAGGSLDQVGKGAESPPPYNVQSVTAASIQHPQSQNLHNQYPQSQYPQSQYPQSQYPQSGYVQGTLQPPRGFIQTIPTVHYLQPGAYYSPSGHSVNVVSQPMPGMMLVTPLMTESGPRPDTTIGLVASILICLFCAWPCGIFAIVANRKADRLADAGQYTAAREKIKSMNVWLVASLLTGLAIYISTISEQSRK